MNPSQRTAIALAVATALAIPAEGLHRVAYSDPPGVLTVCDGHTGADVIRGKVYSLQECDAFLTADMKRAIATVDRCIPGLPVNVLAAFSDAVFNMGPRIACDTANSRAARLLKQGSIPAACEELPKWDKARIAGVLVSLPGLTKRRALERDVCLAPEGPQ